MLDSTNLHANPSHADGLQFPQLAIKTFSPVDSVKQRVPINCRVLHLVNGQHFAGAERVQMHLARCLPDHGVRADFACLLPGRFLEQFDLPDSVAFAAEMKNRFDFAVVKRIVDRCRQTKYQCLHAHTPRSAMIASRVAKKIKLPWVYHLHSPAARDSTKLIGNRINSWVQRWSIRSATHLIAVSNSLREQAIEDGIAAERVTVVHNGVPAIRPKRSATPVAGGHWVIGMVALMRPRKGLEVAIEAVAELREAGHAVKLRCIGPFETESYRASIEILIDRLKVRPAIEFLGFTTDIPAELAKLDLMTLPSLFGEGLPMVVLEAMAAGLPVVATRVEGTPEAIQHGREGLLAEPNNVGSLAEQIRLMITGEYHWMAMSESAVIRHAQHFSDNAMAKATADIYRRFV